jgi:hypothetical protein
MREKVLDAVSARVTWYPYCPIPVIVGGNGLTMARCMLIVNYPVNLIKSSSSIRDIFYE